MPTEIRLGTSVSTEDQLRRFSEGQLLKELKVAGDELTSLGVKTPIPQVLVDGFLCGGFWEDRRSKSDGFGRATPLNFLGALLLRREPELRRSLSDKDFEKLLTQISRLSMVGEILHERFGKVDYQKAGFEEVPSFSSRD